MHKESSSDHFSVLVIEDPCQPISPILERSWSFLTFRTMDPLKASEVIKKNPFDLCLIDLGRLRLSPQVRNLGRLYAHLDAIAVPWVNIEDKIDEGFPADDGVGFSDLMAYEDLENPVFLQMVRQSRQVLKFQEKIGKLEQGLRADREMTATLVNHLAGAILISDRDGYIIYSNEEATEMSGMHEEELLGFHLGNYISGQERQTIELVRGQETRLVEITSFEGNWLGESATFLYLQALPQKKAWKALADRGDRMASEAKPLDIKSLIAG